MQSALVEQFYEAGDAAFRVTARSLEDLFAASGLALSKLIFPKGMAASLAEYTIKLNSPDLESLLVDFLSELIYLFDAQGFIAHAFNFDSLEQTQDQVCLVGSVYGASLTDSTFEQPTESPLGFVPKGVSYHLLQVKQMGDNWRAQFVLDG